MVDSGNIHLSFFLPTRRSQQLALDTVVRVLDAT
jgi:hypothetical protein